MSDHDNYNDDNYNRKDTFKCQAYLLELCYEANLC